MAKISLNNLQLKQIFEVAESCISNDPSLPLMQFAKASVKSDTLSVVSCNGYKLARIKIKLLEACEDVFDFYFQPFKLPKDTTGACIEMSKGEVEIALDCGIGKLVYNIPQPQGEFINADKVFPQTDVSITLNANLLIDALKPFTKTKNRHNSVKISLAKNSKGNISRIKPAVLSYSHDGVVIESLVLPISEFN